MPRSYDRILRFFVPLLIAAALSCTLAFQSKLEANRHPLNAVTFHSLDEGLEGYNLPRPWRPRYFSNATAALFVEPPAEGTSPAAVQARFAKDVALWTGFWALATHLLLIVGLRERSLFFMLGTHAAVSYGYMPSIAGMLYPWDLPALFFFTLFTLALHLRRFEWLLLIPIATGFKETAMLFSVAFLFWQRPWRTRLAWAAGTGLAAVGVKVGLASLTENPSLFFTMSSSAGKRILMNLQYFAEISPRHPLFLNAGLLSAFLLLPTRSREMLMWKTIGALFVAGTAYYGNIWEIRIWFELIPLSLFALAAHFTPALLVLPQADPEQVGTPVENEPPRRMAA